jgi:hypothetical protein
MATEPDEARRLRIAAMVETDDDPEPPHQAPRFHSGQELYETAPAEVPWVWHGYLAQGIVTLFAGRHKGGKSTFLFCLMRAICDRHTAYLDHELDTSGPVVLLTEEGPETLRAKLEPISEDGRERLRVMCRNDITPRGAFGWEHAVREAGMEAIAHRSKVVIVDTFAFWAQVRDENDNALMQQVVSVLGELTAQGLAVLIVHHHRKSGGEDGDAIRGGTALQGAVDLIVEMVRPADAGEDDESTERELRAIGRFPDIPEAMRVRLEGDGWYRKIGEGTRGQMRNLSAEGKIRGYLREQYPGTPTRRDIEDATGVSTPTCNRVLRSMEGIGDIESFADGPGKTAAKRYRWAADTGADDYPKGPLNGA